MSGDEIRIGTRGSALAMIQARMVAAALQAAGARPRLVTVETEGDRRPVDTAFGDGVFVAAIERELLAGRIDVGVHSAKDLPTAPDDRMRIAAYLPRADPRDALVIRVGCGTGLADLPPGARVGTDSPRRTGFLLARRPDLELRPLHGNVDTRLRRLDAGEADALVLAAAGLDRLGLGERIAERLDPDAVPPAPGQGAIAVQVRSDDPIAAVVGRLDDLPTRQVVEAERAFLAACGGGCRSPIGALARVADGVLEIHGGRVEVDGTAPRFARRTGAVGSVAALVVELAELVLGDGPALAAARIGSRARVLVTRQRSQAGALTRALEDVAVEPVIVPAIAVETEPPGGALDAALDRIGTYSWVVVTSGNGAAAVVEAARRRPGPIGTPRWAAIGEQTAAILEAAGIAAAFLPSVASSATLARELPARAGERVLVVRGSLGDGELAAGLMARGILAEEVRAYSTAEAPTSSAGLLASALRAGPLDGVIFTSASTVRGLLTLADRDGVDVGGLPAVCIGQETAGMAARAGFSVVGIAASPDPTALAAATARAIHAPGPRAVLTARGSNP